MGKGIDKADILLRHTMLLRISNHIRAWFHADYLSRGGSPQAGGKPRSTAQVYDRLRKIPQIVNQAVHDKAWAARSRHVVDIRIAHKALCVF